MTLSKLYKFTSLGFTHKLSLFWVVQEPELPLEQSDGECADLPSYLPRTSLDALPVYSLNSFSLSLRKTVFAILLNIHRDYLQVKPQEKWRVSWVWSGLIHCKNVFKNWLACWGRGCSEQPRHLLSRHESFNIGNPTVRLMARIINLW